jgi:hypothetical protein
MKARKTFIFPLSFTGHVFIKNVFYAYDMCKGADALLTSCLDVGGGGASGAWLECDFNQQQAT